MSDRSLPAQHRLLHLLTDVDHTLSFCESLTAGLAAATFAEVPGASAALQGGLITYATELKIDLAGVDPAIVDKHGVVSPQCAEAMAAGARSRCRSDWAVSLTGVAGPDSQDGHPVGEVWIGIAAPDGTIESFAAFTQQEQLELVEFARVQPVAARRKIRIDTVQRCFEILISRLSRFRESR